MTVMYLMAWPPLARGPHFENQCHGWTQGHGEPWGQPTTWSISGFRQRSVRQEAKPECLLALTHRPTDRPTNLQADIQIYRHFILQTYRQPSPRRLPYTHPHTDAT
ncbi:unnamed protein product [Arctogadus glacialis]